jgi:hypothetical protein
MAAIACRQLFNRAAQVSASGAEADHKFTVLWPISKSLTRAAFYDAIVVKLTNSRRSADGKWKKRTFCANIEWEIKLNFLFIRCHSAVFWLRILLDIKKKVSWEQQQQQQQQKRCIIAIGNGKTFLLLPFHNLH